MTSLGERDIGPLQLTHLEISNNNRESFRTAYEVAETLLSISRDSSRLPQRRLDSTFPPIMQVRSLRLRDFRGRSRRLATGCSEGS